MTTIKSVQELIKSPWRGSEKSADHVRNELRTRFGDKVADEYNPAYDCAPYSTWAAAGLKIKKGQRAIKSVTFIDVEDEHGEIQRKVRRTVNLFHRCQLEKVT